MKHFKLEIEGIEYVWHLGHASDVIYQIKRHPGCDFSIYWKSPLTGEYGRIIEKDDVLITFNTALKIPKVFNKLVSM